MKIIEKDITGYTVKLSPVEKCTLEVALMVAIGEEKTLINNYPEEAITTICEHFINSYQKLLDDFKGGKDES